MSDNAFMKYISDKFEDIKKEFEYKIKGLGLKFDEDIFLDTLIKCNETIDSDKISGSQMIGYFWISFKTNTMREYEYCRNRLRDDLTKDIPEENDEYSYEDDFNDVTYIIKKEFGDELLKLFQLHTNGATYDELEEITDISELKYKFRKIRDFVKNNFKRNY